MAWILSTLWSALPIHAKTRRERGPSAVWSRSSRSTARGKGAQVSGVHAPGACAPSVEPQAKRYYSLMIEVRPGEMDAGTLELFSDAGSSGLAATLNLPAGCELRRCMDMSREVAEVLIRM